ncbi:MAG TPA: DUF4832 domain-containing protein [Capsulimonadaceae bacterium]|jgi:hypothetical protein
MLKQIALVVLVALIAVLPCDAQQLAVPQNPMRGFYEWYRHNQITFPSRPTESYVRYRWNQLETSKNVYDFSLIDADIAKAHASGQRFAFRVMSASSGAGAVVPADMVGDPVNGVWLKDPKTVEKDNTYFPDWNSPEFLDRAKHLIDALGKRYDGNPDIVWVEIGTYGNWGEWHTYPYSYTATDSVTIGTDDTKRSIVDMYLNAFHKTRLIMMTDDSVALLYALSKRDTVGFRRDSLGHPWFENGLQRDPARLAAVMERWKTAPFVTEFFGYSATTPDLAAVYETARQQVIKYHVSTIGNGNIGKGAATPPDALAAIFRVADSAGYNLHIAAVATPLSAGRERSVRVAATWTNTGCAPTYDPWDVTYALLDLSGEPRTVAKLGKSPIDLRTILPEPDGHALTVSDTFKLPTNLAPGQYGVAVKIASPTGSWPDMRLEQAQGAEMAQVLVARFTVR